MPTDRKTIHQALRQVPYDERRSILKTSLASAMETLPDTQAGDIPAMVDDLAGAIEGVGPKTALEVLAAVGTLWSENGQ
jgi:adenine-specific DNA glycosylase